jgi:hypothetical protein
LHLLVASTNGKKAYILDGQSESRVTVDVGETEAGAGVQQFVDDVRVVADGGEH